MTGKCCRICSVPLELDVNWRASQKRQYDYRCAECHIKSSMKYVKANPDNHNKHQKAWREKNPLAGRMDRQMHSAAKSKAKKQGIPFDIEVADIVIPETCPILGIPIMHGEKGRSSSSPSLIMIDPSKGFVKGNIQVISYGARRKLKSA